MFKDHERKSLLAYYYFNCCFIKFYIAYIDRNYMVRTAVK